VEAAVYYLTVPVQVVAKVYNITEPRPVEAEVQ
jgi:hypothetical protein